MPGNPSKVRLWDLGSGLALGEVRHFLEETFGPAVGCSPPRRLLPEGKLGPLARRLMDQRIPELGRLGTAGARFSAAELAVVARILDGKADPAERRASLFSGVGLSAALSGALGRTAFHDGNMHIVFTSALPCTWDTADCRFHPRAVVCGFPSVVSVSGAIEGPEKPRGYYVAKMMGLTEEEARRKYIGRFLEHDDSRLSEVAKGLAAQAVFYNLTGEPFCEKEGCRLFNARWQEQLVESHINNGKFCDLHGRYLKELRRRGRE